jgi:ribonuclease HI
LTIDLTFANLKLEIAGIVSSCTIMEDLATRSDHVAISIQIEFGKNKIREERNGQFNFKKADWEKFRQTLEKEVGDSDILQCLLKTDCMPQEQLDKAVTKLSESLWNAAENSTKRIQISKHSQQWWNKAIKKLHAEAAKAARERDQSKKRGEIEAEVQCKYSSSKDWLKREIRRAKRAAAEKEMSEADANTIWKIKKWPATKRTYPTPMLKHNGTIVTYHGEKCKLFWEVLFPKTANLNVKMPEFPEPGDNDTDPEWNLPTKTEICSVLLSWSPDAAPGPDQITSRALKAAWPVLKAYLCRLIIKCVNSGYHPTDFCLSITFILRKVNKLDYTKLRAYQPIALLQCLGKVVEKLMADCISHFALTRDIIPPTQFGGAPGCSSIDAALTLCHDTELVWNHRETVLILTFDITGYFDHIHHAKLLAIMTQLGFPIQIVCWVKSFLGNCQTSVLVDSLWDLMKAVDCGVLQGSPTSPILGTIYTQLLFKLFCRKLRLLGYIDDSLLITSCKEKTVEQAVIWNNKNLCKAYMLTLVYMWEHGLSLDLVKQETQHLTKSTKRPAEWPKLFLLSDKGGEWLVKHKEVLCWLGFYLDTKLSFNTHVCNATEKAKKAVEHFCMLGNTIHSLCQHHLQHLYLTCILLIMTYGCAAWWRGKKSQVEMLETVQNTAIWHMLGVFKTSPTLAIQIEASIPPIHLMLDHICANTALRLARLHQMHPITQRLPPVWRWGEPFAHHPPPVPPTPMGQGATKHCSTRLLDLAETLLSGIKLSQPAEIPLWDLLTAKIDQSFIILPPDLETLKEDAAKEHKIWARERNNDLDTLLIYTDRLMLSGGEVTDWAQDLIQEAMAIWGNNGAEAERIRERQEEWWRQEEEERVTQAREQMERQRDLGKSTIWAHRKIGHDGYLYCPLRQYYLNDEGERVRAGSAELEAEAEEREVEERQELEQEWEKEEVEAEKDGAEEQAREAEQVVRRAAQEGLQAAEPTDQKKEVWKWQRNLPWSRGWTGDKNWETARRVGVGFTVRQGSKTIVECSIGLGSWAEVFDTELLVIADTTSEACGYAEQNNIPNITICTDSAAAIVAITSTKMHRGQQHTLQIWQSVVQFLLANNKNKVTLKWVPAHVRVPGNEHADHLAKVGTILPPRRGLPKTTQVHVKRLTKEHLLHSFENHTAKGRYPSRYHTIQTAAPTLNPQKHLALADQAMTSLLIQVCLGHAFTGEYYQKHVPNEEPSCTCSTRLQTCWHILKECVDYEHSWHHLTKISPQVEEHVILGTPEGLSTLAKFIRCTSAFKKCQVALHKPPALQEHCHIILE